MNKSFLNYVIQLAAVAIVFVTLYLLLKDVLAARFYSGSWKIAVVLFIIFSFSHFGMLQKKEAGGTAVVRYTMAAIAIKMFLMMILLLGYVVLNRDSAIPFVICFFMGYLFFTVFDVAKNYKLMKARQ